MDIDPTTTKYLIKAKMEAEGIIEKPDVVGAIFGQTEGLLGEELDLRDLQKSGRIGRIEVEVFSKKGKSEGKISIPSSLDQIETSILASALETIDRVGPCKAHITVDTIEDIRLAKRSKIVERAKVLLTSMMEQSKQVGSDLTESVRKSVHVDEIVTYGDSRLPAGPNIDASDAIIIVEGRADVLNLLRSGIKNAIAVEGTNIPRTIADISRDKVVTAFLDGDRGGELILKELLQVAEVDFIARAPKGREVEELSQKQIMKALRNKMPVEQFLEMYGFGDEMKALAKNDRKHQSPKEAHAHGGQGNHGPPRREPEPKRAPKLSPELEGYRNILKDLTNTSKAVLIDKEGKMNEVPVRDLLDTLKKNADVKTLVFDGIVTQRILDIANEIGLTTVFATKIGNVTKQPADIEIWTKDDL
jgi:DNA primase